MKKALRHLSALTFTTVIAVSTLASVPAYALELLTAAGSMVPSVPAVETLALGIIGLGCLGIARQRVTG